MGPSKKPPSNTRFGALFSALFAFGSAYLLTKDANLLSLGAGLCAATLALLAWRTPKTLTGVNRLWMRFGELLGRLISPVILGVIFILLFTPVAVLTRLFGRDELNLKLRPKASHWRTRDSQSLSEDPFKMQF
jgi:Mg2+/citrate symporter